METLHEKISGYLGGNLTVDQLNDWLYWAAFEASEPWDIDVLRQELAQYSDRANVAHLLNAFKHFNRKLRILENIQQSLDRILSCWTGEMADEALIKVLIGNLELYVIPLDRKQDRFKPYLRVCFQHLQDDGWKNFNRFYFKDMKTVLATLRQNANS